MTSMVCCLTQVKDHARQLLEKYIGKPFLDARYAGKAARMEAKDVEEGLQWLEDRFHVIRNEDDELPSVDWVLGLARAAVLRCFIAPHPCFLAVWLFSSVVQCWR